MATAVSDFSPPESRESRLTFLPGGRASTSTPVVSRSLGVGQQQPALAAGEQRREHLLELALDVGIGLGEHLQDAGVDVGDHVEQSLRAALTSSSCVARKL